MKRLNNRLFISYFDIIPEPGKKYYLTQDRSIDQVKITGILGITDQFQVQYPYNGIDYVAVNSIDSKILFLTLLNHNQEKVLDRVPFSTLQTGNAPAAPFTGNINRKYYNLQILTGECYFETSALFTIAPFAIPLLIEYTE